MVVLLQVLAVLAVVFGVAVVLTGRAEGMSEEGQDLADTGIPRDRPMTPQDVIGLRFALALRGYRMSEVDDALDRLAAELAARDEIIDRLRSGAEPGPDDARWWAAPPTGEEPAAAGELAAVGEPAAVGGLAAPGDELGPAAGAGAAGGLGAGEAAAMPSTPVTVEAATADVAGALDDEPETWTDDVEEPDDAAGTAEWAPVREQPAEWGDGSADEPPAVPEPEPVAFEPVGSEPAVGAAAAREPAVSEAEPAAFEPASSGPLPVPPTPPADEPPAERPAAAVAAADDPLFGALPETANPFRPEVPEIPTYDPWSVTPRSRYTDGPEYLEVDHPDDDAAHEVAAEHQTGYAPPPVADPAAAGAEPAEPAEPDAAGPPVAEERDDEGDEDAPPLRPWQS